MIEPKQTADMTGQLLELMASKGKTSLLNHIAQCMCLLLVFVVLYTFTCINAIKNLTAPSPSFKVSASLPAPSSSSKKSPTSSTTTTKQTASKNNNAPVKTPMRSTADLATSHDKQVEPIATTNNNKQSTNHAQITPSGPSPAPSSTTTVNDADKGQLTQLVDNDTIIKKQDPTTTQVIPMKAQQEHVDVAEKDQVAQPAIPVQTPEATHPQQTVTIATTAAAATPPKVVDQTTTTPPASDERSKKEQYYEEINRKGNDLMAFSDNLQRIFDEPPTPSPDHHVRPFSMIQQPSNTAYLDEAISTTPALTPPNQSSAAGSTLSRKSSMASQHSVLKSKLQQAFQKVGRSSTISITHNNNNNNNNKQQHNDDITAAPAAPSPPEPSKSKRFSSIRFSRRKAPQEQETDVATTEASNPIIPEAPAPKKSKSKSIVKKAFHRTTRLFSTTSKPSS